MRGTVASFVLACLLAIVVWWGSKRQVAASAFQQGSEDKQKLVEAHPGKWPWQFKTDLDERFFLLRHATRTMVKANISFAEAVRYAAKRYPIAASKDRVRRHLEFPSVAERVRYYMGSWSNITEMVMVPLHAVAETPMMDVPFLLTAQHVATKCKPCASSRSATRILAIYCAAEAVGQLVAGGPKIVSFGDTHTFHARLPIFAKAAKPGLSRTPILWKLNVAWHYGWAQKLPLPETRWSQKKEVALFRGAPTGRVRNSIHYGWNNSRHQFVRRYANSTHSELVDVGFSFAFSADEARFVKKALGRRSLLRHKYLVALEGNDVATGLKWMLFSDSVVMMPPPTVATWALETTLQPFVHFIPLKPDGSDLLQMVHWARSNDEKARAIAKQATLFMYDLLFHPDAKGDEVEVRSILVKRYEENVRFKGSHTGRTLPGCAK